MARETKADLEQKIKDLTRWYDEQAVQIRELRIDLQNARLENIGLREKLKEYEGQTERVPERFTVIPDPPKRGARRKADPETRQYIHELRKYGNSLQAIAGQTGMSKTQCHTILKEEEIPGRWYSEQDGARTYYEDYAAAVQSKKAVHFEATV